MASYKEGVSNKSLLSLHLLAAVLEQHRNQFIKADRGEPAHLP
jgi:hypothetical protein